MKKLIIILTLFIAVMLFSGCTNRGDRDEIQTFNSVKIQHIDTYEKNTFGDYHYTIHFTNGMKKEWVYDQNAPCLDFSKTMDITFIEGEIGWHIKSFNYLE